MLIYCSEEAVKQEGLTGPCLSPGPILTWNWKNKDK